MFLKFLPLTECEISMLRARVEFSNRGRPRYGLIPALLLLLRGLLRGCMRAPLKGDGNDLSHLIISGKSYVENPSISERAFAVIGETPSASRLVIDSQSLYNYFLVRALLYSLPYWVFYISVPKSDRYFVRQILLPMITAMRVKREIKKTGFKKVVFMLDSQDIRNIILSFLLRSEGQIECYYYVGKGALEEGYCVGADYIVFANRWTYESYRRSGCFASAKGVKYLKSQLNMGYKAKSIESRFQSTDVGVYTSGYYARLNRKHRSAKFLYEMALLEQIFLFYVRNLAVLRPDLKFKIYPHPRVERQIPPEFAYPDFLSFSNFSLAVPGTTSSQEFLDVSLGLSLPSNVFFERIEQGLKSYCIVNDLAGGVFNHPQIKNISGSPESLNNDLLNKFSDMSRSEFRALIGSNSATADLVKWGEV